MTFDEVLGRFKAKHHGNGYKAHCPIHDDSKESLSINLKGDRILVKCFAGCDTKAVLEAVGLTMKDLFESSGNRNAKPLIVATYVYRDRAGEVRYRKQRTASKAFWFERSDGHGGWIKSARQNGGKPVMEGVTRLPYRLNELDGCTALFVTEGEKDADRLWSLGLPATTNDGGAGKWTDALTAQLTGVSDVWVLEDHDETGRDHAQIVARSCHAAGMTVRVVSLPDLSYKGDVSDYLDAGHSMADFVAECDRADVYVPPIHSPTPGDPLAAAIARLNERFAIVSVGSKVVVMETWPDGAIKELWPFPEFKKLLIKDRIEMEAGMTTKMVELAGVWLAHQNGRRYNRLVYVMPGSIEQLRPDDYNGWLGFTVKPQPGDWSRNREHLRRIICGGNQMAYEWVFNWCANLVQWPGRRAMSSLVLRGKQGSGKGHFVDLMLGALFFRQQYLHILGAGTLTGQFNEHLSGKVLVFADESTWGGDPKAADKLKGMITESFVPIERKFLPLVDEPSALHIVIASNNDWPIAIPRDDRRFMVLDVLEDEKQNDAYFVPLRAELAAGGLAAMLHDLLAHPIDEHALRHPLSTAGKREVMAQSLKPIERWWYEKLLNGSLSFNTTNKDGDIVFVEGWPGSIAKAALHEDYLSFLDKHRDTRTRRSTETELGMFLAKYTPMQTQRRLPGTKTKEKTQSFWNLPTLVECRSFWAKACGWPEDFKWEEAEG